MAQLERKLAEKLVPTEEEEREAGEGLGLIWGFPKIRGTLLRGSPY